MINCRLINFFFLLDGSNSSVYDNFLGAALVQRETIIANRMVPNASHCLGFHKFTSDANSISSLGFRKLLIQYTTTIHSSLGEKKEVIYYIYIYILYTYIHHTFHGEVL